MQNGPLLVLLFGGENAERHVSVASAQNILSAVPDDCELQLLFWRPDATVQFVSQQQLRCHTNPYTNAFQPQLMHTDGCFESGLDIRQAMKTLARQARSHKRQVTVLLAVHGIGCEDGLLQRVMEQEGLAFTGSGSQASARAFNKIKAKQHMQQQGILVAQHLLLESIAGQAQQVLTQQFLRKHGALVMKQVQEGSSSGLQFLHTHADVVRAIQIAARDARPILVEPKLSGIELTVSVVQDESGCVSALPCTQVKPQVGRCFDYAGKYLGDGVQEITPAQIPNALAKQAQAMAIKAHTTLGCRGYSRTDCIATPDGIVFLEINTLPGLGCNSFIPQQLRVAGIHLQQFISTQLHIARHACRVQPHESRDSISC